MASEELKRKLNHFKNRLISSNQKNKLPATIIGAEYKCIKIVDSSGMEPNPISHKLEFELTKIAPLGQRGYDNIVGRCSEVRSSNKVLEVAKYIAPPQVVFTSAIRPRTG